MQLGSIAVTNQHTAKLHHVGSFIYINAVHLWLWNAYDTGTTVSRSVKNLSYRLITRQYYKKHSWSACLSEELESGLQPNRIEGLSLCGSIQYRSKQWCWDLLLWHKSEAHVSLGQYTTVFKH